MPPAGKVFLRRIFPTSLFFFFLVSCSSVATGSDFQTAPAHRTASPRSPALFTAHYTPTGAARSRPLHAMTQAYDTQGRARAAFASST